LAELLAAADGTLVVVGAGSEAAARSEETRRVLAPVMQSLRSEDDEHRRWQQQQQQRWQQPSRGRPDGGDHSAIFTSAEATAGVICSRLRRVLDRGREWSAAGRLLARDYLRRPQHSGDENKAAEVVAETMAAVGAVVRFASSEAVELLVLTLTTMTESQPQGAAAAAAAATAAATPTPAGLPQCGQFRDDSLRLRLEDLRFRIMPALLDDAMSLLRQRSGRLTPAVQRQLGRLVAEHGGLLPAAGDS
jgi:hypothetical protein